MDNDELERAAHLIAHELGQVVDLAGLLAKVRSHRDAGAEGWIDALFVHERCLIGLLCGDYAGRWRPTDIKPSDYLGRDWVLPDEELDQQLRGRLPVINRMMAHLSWDQVTDETPIRWSGTFLAHEITYAVGLFIRALDKAGSSSHPILSAAHARAQESLPQWTGRDPQTPVNPAPPRRRGSD